MTHKEWNSYQLEVELAQRELKHYEVKLLEQSIVPDFEETQELISKIPMLIKYIKELEGENKHLSSKID